jgi:hypothetical protein
MRQRGNRTLLYTLNQIIDPWTSTHINTQNKRDNKKTNQVFNLNLITARNWKTNQNLFLFRQPTKKKPIKPS